MKRLVLILLILFSFIKYAGATHNRAGEITFVQLSDLTYRVTLITYTYTLSYADRPELTIEWGDNSSSVVQRDKDLIVYLPNYYKKNVYITTHTFPGPGVYKIVMQDPNRNFGVKNIPNSVNVVFSVSTILIVNPAMGRNASPVMLNPPYDKAAKGHIFIHNPAAFDPDGDSLSYKLTKCTREDGRPIENYTLPPATNKIYIDSLSGDLVWDTPRDTGKYNVAIEIQEWRNNKKIGVVIRDMQIDVFNTKNNPPVIAPLKDFCIQVGDSIDFLVSATDKDNDSIKLSAFSGVFDLTSCSSSFTKETKDKGLAVSRFKWKPCFESVRNQPYNIVFKAEDNNSDLSLFDMLNIKIKVLGPAPVISNAVPIGKSVRVTWNPYISPFVAGYSIYRSESNPSFSLDSCTSGIPISTGFIKVGYVNGSSTISFTDNDNGNGLQFGVEYYYRITAVFPNGTESKVSEEVSSTLVSGIPVIRNVSVRNTGTTDGSILLAWMKPVKVPPPGPFRILISRSEGITGSIFNPVDSITTADLNDTTYIDTLLNTQAKAYIYKVVLYNIAGGIRDTIGEPSYASSLFMELTPGDKKTRFIFRRNVPWINSRYDIFRLNGATMNYDSIGTTNLLSYTDAGLVNGTQYCYYVRSTGSYQQLTLPQNLVNFSEKSCITPVDNEAPCTPVLTVSSKCEDSYNLLKWTVNDPACFTDIEGYKIYYKPKSKENDSLIAVINDKYTFEYTHDSLTIIAGCYSISAFDGAANESAKSPMICVDSCDFYEIPNVFTPNNDTFNDFLVAKTSGMVEKVDFRLFNRNGLMLFKTDDPKINWDGKYKGKIVSPGVYFYQCDVTERRIGGIQTIHRSGFVHVITELGDKNQVVNK